MKKTFRTIPWWILSFMVVFSCKLAQRTTPMPHTECDSLVFDLEDGMINSVSPMLNQAEIKEWFTCYTFSIPDGASSNCGGGVFYKRHGFSYYTYYNYVEVSKKFTGKLSRNLLGISRTDAGQLFGDTVFTKYERPEYPDFDFYAAPYGCLRMEYSNDTLVRVSSHFTLCENVDVCPTHE